MTLRLSLLIALCAALSSGAAWGGVLGETGTGAVFLSCEGNARGVLRADPDDSPTATATADSLTGYLRFIFDNTFSFSYCMALYRVDSAVSTFRWCTLVDSTAILTQAGVDGDTVLGFKSHPTINQAALDPGIDYVPVVFVTNTILGRATVGYVSSGATGDTALSKTMTTAWLSPTDFTLVAAAKPSVYCTYTLVGGGVNPREIILKKKRGYGMIQRALECFAEAQSDFTW